MPKINRTTALLLSLLFGLATVLLFFVATNSIRKDAQKRPEGPESTTIIVARTDITPRTLISERMVELKSVPIDKKPSGALTDFTEVSDKVATQLIPAGQTLTEMNVAPRGPSLGMSYSLPKNMRAMSVPLDPVSGVAGFLKAGDRVDVLATYTMPDQSNVTNTILQDVELLAIGSQSATTAQYKGGNEPAVGGGREDPNRPTVEATTATLAVTPEEMQILALAESRGKLQLALRPADDTAKNNLRPASSAEIFGGRVPARTMPPAAGPAPVQAPGEVVQMRPAPTYREPVAAPAPRTEPRRPAATQQSPTRSVTVIRGTQNETVEVPQ